MKEKTFKPLLAPNDEIDLSTLQYHLLASYKLDGCRLLSKSGQLVTRSLKKLPSKQLNEKFEPIRKYSETEDLILDGEIYAPGIPFQFIVSCFMTQDYEAKLAKKKWTELCEEHDFHMSRDEVFNQLKFYSFDCLDEGMLKDCYFKARYEFMQKCMFRFPEIAFSVEHVICNTPEEIQMLFEQALSDGFEGLILRNPKGMYKFGRASVKQNIIFKYKPFVTTDAIIKGFVQATEVNKDAEKTINELGRSCTSKKAENRHVIEKTSGFIVDFNGKDMKVPIAMTDAQKKYIWSHQEEYIGKWIEYKYMEIGMKKDGLPRIPKFVRMRPDKD